MLLDLWPYRFGSGTLKYWNGSEWIVKPMYRYDSPQWIYGGLKYWNGSIWT